MNIIPTNVIHEDSNLDVEKDMIFIRLVYLCELNDDINNIKLDYDEHSEYRFIESLDELKGELISSFIEEVFIKNIARNI